LPQLVGRPAHRIEFLAARGKEANYLRFVKRLSGRRPIEDG